MRGRYAVPSREHASGVAVETGRFGNRRSYYFGAKRFSGVERFAFQQSSLSAWVIGRIQQAVPSRRVGAFGRRPVRPRSDLAAVTTATLKYPPPGSLVLFLTFLEALATPAIITGHSIWRLEVEAVLERIRVSLQYTPTGLLGQYQIVSDMFLETRVRYPHVLRSRNDHAQARLIDVVFHAKVRRHSVHQHPVVRRHVGELVTDFLSILRKFDQLFLDLQQDRSILLITIYRLRDELFQIYSSTVRVQLGTAISRQTRRRAVEATLRRILMPQLVPRARPAHRERVAALCRTLVVTYVKRIRPPLIRPLLIVLRVRGQVRALW